MTSFAEAFELLLDAYDREGSVGQARVYADVLDDQPIELVYLAAEAWIRTEDRMPTPHQWLTSVRSLKAADKQRPEPVPTGGSVATLMVRVTRQAIRDVKMPAHDHSGACPICTNRGYWQDRISERSARILEELTEESLPEDPETLYRCRDCWDESWIVVGGDDDHRNASKPCPTCLPELHQRWAEGHFRPNHSCSQCELGRRGVR